MVSMGKKIAVLLDGRNLTFVQVRPTGAGCAIQASAACALPARLDAAAVPELARSIRQALAAGRISSKRGILGLEGHLLMAREKRLPAGIAQPAEIAATLRLDIEREYGSAADELGFDCLGPWPLPEGSAVQQVTAGKNHWELVCQALQAAGLEVQAVTGMGLCLAQHTPTPADAGVLLLRLTPAGAEMIARQGPRILAYRWLALANPQELSSSGYLDQIARESKRASASLSEPPAACWIWQETGTPEIARWSKALGLPVQTWALPQPENPAPTAVPGVLLAALLAHFSQRSSLPFDLLHSRLAPPQSGFWNRTTRIGVAAAAALLVLLTAAYFLLLGGNPEHARLQAQFDELEPRIKALTDLSGKVELARGWFDRRTPVLPCLRELTLAFPATGGIWVTNLSMNEEGKGVCAGRAADRDTVLALLDKLRGQDVFVQVDLQYLRPGGSGAEVSYAFSFTYNIGENPSGSKV